MADEKQETKEVEVPLDVPKDAQPADWMNRSILERQLRVAIRGEYEEILKIWKNTELDQVRKDSEKIANEGIQKVFNEWKEQQKPPSHDDIQQLLSQEYATFTVKVDYVNDKDEEKSEVFTLRELPQAAEKKFYRQFKETILTKIGALQAFSQSEIDQPFEKKVHAFLELFDEAPDMMADATVIVLNPFDKRKDINRTWVQGNISSMRQWNIIEAQIMVNRLKDFFSKLSSSGQTTQTMLGGLSFQTLQQQAR
jgi:hypothetical protein